MFVNDQHSTVTRYCDKVNNFIYFYSALILCSRRLKLHVVKEAIQSSSSLPFIINFNLFVNAKSLTDFSPYFKVVIQYCYCQFSPVSA